VNAPSTHAYSICRLDTFTTGGLRPPLLVGNASAGRIMRIPAGNSTGTSLRPGTRPLHMRIHLRIRYVHHGGFTPPAPGCVCGRCCKCATLADGKTLFLRRLTPPALDARAGGVSAGAHAVRGLFVRECFLFASGFWLLLAVFGSQPGLTCISHQCSSGCCLRCSEGEAGTSPGCGSLCLPMPRPTDTRPLERGSRLCSSTPGWMDKGDSSELGRQVPPSHVGTPSLGNTQICKINHSPMMAAKMSSSIADSLIGRMVSHRLPGRLGLP
jgi:hypothetical protein